MTSESFEREYGKLNAAQKKAVNSIEGPVMVIAGPGSGKTQILSLRVANILLKTDARPGNILCLTFTDAAAVNMRKRLATMIGPDAYRVAIFTFHGFGTEIIERYPEYFYGGARFAPADELAQIGIIEDILANLPFGNPLKSRHPEQGYTYLYDIRTAIGSLKKAGISPDEFSRIVEHNAAAQEKLNGIIGDVFEARLSSKSIAQVRAALARARKIRTGEFPVPQFLAYADALVQSLESAAAQAEEGGKTEPLSKWKSSHTVKSESGERVLKDYAALPKLRALAEVYAAYRAKSFEQGFYDFDDMLLEAIGAIESNGALRAELQEQFQYVLVDEFQDTNDAQMRLLRLLLSAEVNEGRPNIMIVGDDDQAIYKFQGAELNNILGFKKMYKDPAVVTLTHNYRSTQDILDIARFVIERGEERLEKLIPEIRKELIAANPDVFKGKICARSFPTIGHEYAYVAKEIKKLIESGEDPKEMAVIARKHRLLEELVPFLNAERIPLSYERQSDVLEEPHVRQLLSIARFVTTLARKDRDAADHLLPAILSFPFWGLARKEVWNISVEADKRHALWLDVMLGSSDEKIRAIADFFLALAALSKHEIAERVLDAMIGSHVALAPDTEYDDEDEDAGAPSTGAFTSPFKEYYFSAERLKEDKGTYLIFLSSLRTFVHAIREHKKGKLIGLDDVVGFADLHEKNGLGIPDTSVFVSSSKSVNLLTAHKAKGLEYKTVFVINCQDEVWAGRGAGRKISFPLNLPITPAGDTIDDQLRLFYVALTRAKSNLYMTASETTGEGRDALRLQFLLPRGDGAYGNPAIAQALSFGEESDIEPTDVLATTTTSLYRNPVTYEEEAILRSLVEDYRMSVTHLNNYLNVTKGGPILFLEQNLIRFPQEKTLSSKFGTAMHSVIERIYSRLRTEGSLADLETVSGWLRFELGKERMRPEDFLELHDRGTKSFEALLSQKRDSFDPSHRIEVNFKNQGATVGEAHLAGKIDKMAPVRGGAANEWSVHDFKTGRAATSWDGGDDYEKIKLHQYEYQLIFYKLLVENSREFCDRCVVRRGCLEFLEPVNGRIVELPLDLDDGNVERVKRLIEIVYRKIKNLEFPDVSGYDHDISGILAFEEDLLNKVV